MVSYLKWLIILISLCFSLKTRAQAYQQLRIADWEYATEESHTGIVCESINPKEDGTYSVSLFNSNYSDSGVITTYSFTWYLSYKGKRISDYNKTSLRCRRSTTINAYAWPESVPTPYRKYVTVQFGVVRETNYRDDEY